MIWSDISFLLSMHKAFLLEMQCKIDWHHTQNPTKNKKNRLVWTWLDPSSPQNMDYMFICIIFFRCFAPSD